MKNLFDFATKELSQDAFLRWFIEHASYDCDNKEIQEYAIKFLEFLTDNVISLDRDKVKVKTFAQVDHIDVSVDIYPDKDEKLHHILVIEDKTTSSEHRQLKNYDESIKSWETYGGEVFRVFYKTGFLSQADKDGLEEANKGKDKHEKWKAFEIPGIFEFFGTISDTPSDVLNDYCEYITKLYQASIGVLTDNLEDISITEWEGFVKYKYSKFQTVNSSIWVDDYQKRYVTICYERNFKNSLNAGVIEIFIRDKKHLSCVFHHAFYADIHRKNWSIKHVERKEIKADAIREKLVEYVKGSGEVTKVRNDAYACFGKFDDELTAKNTQEAINKIDSWIERFDEVMDDIEKKEILKGLEFNLKNN